MLRLGACACGLALLLLLPGVGAAQAPAQVTGEVLYRERILPPQTARLLVQLVDVSRADAPAIVLSQQETELQGKGPPYAFSLPYDPARIDPRFTYAVEARITDGDQLLFINTTRFSVITNGAPTSGVQVIIERVSPSPSGTPSPRVGGGGGSGVPVTPRPATPGGLPTTGAGGLSSGRADWLLAALVALPVIALGLLRRR